jgi:type IV secretory pathway TrbF-like protein
MGQVLDFTQKKQEKEVEELERDLNDADMIIEDMIDEIGEMLDSYGLTERNEKIAKDFYYVMEAMRSLVYDYMDIEHPFQEVVERTIDCSINESDNTYYVYWKEKATDEGRIEQILDMGEEYND